MAKMKTYRIEARSDERYRVAVRAGNRTLYVDQSTIVGGTDAGATPVEYLFSSLAGCIATTARIMAGQKKVALSAMDIAIEGALDLEIIYGKSRENRAGFPSIAVNIALESDMSEAEQKLFLEELQARCPVCDTISGTLPLGFSAG